MAAIISKQSHRPLFRALTLRLELFTHFVAVPVSVYFSVVAVPMSPEERMIGMFTGAVAGLVMVTLGTIWRFYRLRSLIAYAHNTSDKSHLKDLLLAHPRAEARAILIRWGVGLPLAHLAYIQMHSYNPLMHTSLPFALLAIAPISALAYFMISESVIAGVLSAPELRGVELPEGRPIRRLGYFGRITFTIVALMLMPLSIMGYLLFQVVEGRLNLADPLFHIALMVGLFLVPAMIAGTGVATAVRRGLREATTTLSELGAGNFDVSAATVTADEFGEHAAHLDAVIGHLRQMVSEIREMNVNLERRVEERTEQLETSLTEVRALKTQQDGDYYLTSLLTAPLAQAGTSSETVCVETLTKQKKHFVFRNKEAEIGGDLCSAHQIRLRNHPYVAFINGDAMGKSMQGAGGAIVLGTVFKAIVARTHLSESDAAGAGTSDADSSPEEWVFDCYSELQRVFESFDGLMLASAIGGLVDEVSGAVYYFNAEHPQPVLLRNDRASFLCDAPPTAKLGVAADLGSPFRVAVSVLAPGDALLCGSDGRDDLVIHQGEDGRRLINTDENLFLSNVEQSGGRLPDLLDALQRSGELIDDCSLLKITYRIDEGTLALPGLPAQQIEGAQSLLLQGRHAEAARAFGELAVQDPGNAEWLYRAGYACKLARRFEEGRSYARRCELRRPDFAPNLVNLSDLYRLLGRRREARRVLERALALHPEHAAARKLSRLLDAE